MTEQTKEPDGSISEHTKLTGFDGTYYIIRVDVSEIIKDKGDGYYLHVNQENNKALMVAYGIEGTTFANMGNKTGSYSLANNAAALKDTTGNYKDTPYFDVILMSSGKLAAGADAGKEDAPGADIKLSFYVDQTEDYNPDLKLIDAQSMPAAWPATICDQEFNTEQDYLAALMAKFYKAENATEENNASSYLVKGSDLEIDVTVEDTETAGEEPDFWSLTNAMEYQPYDSHVVKLICEVPVFEGLSVKSTDETQKRNVVLDVNSFDIQVANNTEQGVAGIVVSDNATLKIKDGSSTAGAELAIGNNATKVTLKKGLKKGRYTVKIKITAKGNKNYKAKSKTVKVKVVVKETITKFMRAIVNYIQRRGYEADNIPCEPDMCADWVSKVYGHATGYFPSGNAIDYWYKYADTGSSDLSTIPPGAIVVGHGSGIMGQIYGHIGIYFGNGMVISNKSRGVPETESLEAFASWQKANGGLIGWVFPGANTSKRSAR